MHRVHGLNLSTLELGGVLIAEMRGKYTEDTIEAVRRKLTSLVDGYSAMIFCIDNADLSGCTFKPCRSYGWTGSMAVICQPEQYARLADYCVQESIGGVRCMAFLPSQQGEALTWVRKALAVQLG